MRGLPDQGGRAWRSALPGLLAERGEEASASVLRLLPPQWDQFRDLPRVQPCRADCHPSRARREAMAPAQARIKGADFMETLINAVGGIATFLALTIGWIIIVEAIRLLAGRKVDAQVAMLRRRLADLEALRRRDGFMVAEPNGDLHAPALIRKHMGEPPYSARPICDETEGDGA